MEWQKQIFFVFLLYQKIMMNFFKIKSGRQNNLFLMPIKKDVADVTPLLGKPRLKPPASVLWETGEKRCGLLNKKYLYSPIKIFLNLRDVGLKIEVRVFKYLNPVENDYLLSLAGLESKF